jgi:hypothetical protein
MKYLHMKTNFLLDDINVIIESLQYSIYKFENYEKYPSADFKQKRIDKIASTLHKVQHLKKELQNVNIALI